MEAEIDTMYYDEEREPYYLNDYAEMFYNCSVGILALVLSGCFIAFTLLAYSQ